MSLDVAKLAALLAPIVEELRRPEPAPVVEALAIVFMTRRDYAKRVSLSPRTLDLLIGRGLPVVGRERLLRIDVAGADRWLRAHLADEPVEPEDEDAALALANATKGAR